MLRRWGTGVALHANEAQVTRSQESLLPYEPEDPSREVEREELNSCALLDRFGGDSQLLSELVSIYLSQSPSLLAAAQAALQKEDGRELARLAHTIKGSAGNFNARAVVETAERLERFAAQRDFPRAGETLSSLGREMERFSRELDSVCGVAMPASRSPAAIAVARR